MSSWWNRWTRTERAIEDRRRVRRAWLRFGVYLLLGLALYVAHEQREVWRPENWEGKWKYGAALGIGMFVWRASRAWADALHLTMRHRTDPGTAGMSEFVVRLGGMLLSAGVVLQVIGVQPKDLLLGGAITAGVFILTAREPLGNLVAGLMLASARPFRVGDQIQLQGGNLAGQFEGRVHQLGLMYTVFEEQGQLTMVPNTLLVTSAVTPLDETPPVDFEAQLRPGITPYLVQQLLETVITVELRSPPHVELRKVTDQVLVRIAAVPVDPDEGGLLADQVLGAIKPLVHTGDVEPLDTGEFHALVK